MCAGKKVPSNASYAGNPAKLIKQGVFFTNKCVHQWTEEMTAENEIDNSDKWIYSHDKNTVSLASVDEAIKRCKSAEEKLEYLQNGLPKGKNRFYIEPKKTKKGLFSR